MESNKIIIIGAGVSGITTALTMQLLGYDTQIIAEKTYDSITDKKKHPEFASLFPAASIIPRSTYSAQLAPLFKYAQTLFNTLHHRQFPGVDIHKHFEIFEEPTEWPAYKNWMHNFIPIDELENKKIPCRPEIDKVYGWRFDCLFADWPRYFRALIEFYNESGGRIKQKKLTVDDISGLDSSAIINCSGAGSAALFEDPSDSRMVLRGHLLHKTGAAPVTDQTGTPVSYNYTPRSEVYSDANGKACDVYFYPRRDGWVIGGSRQPGTLHDGRYQAKGKATHAPNYTIGNISFPAQIVDLNEDILRHSFGSQLGDISDLTVSAGYRYIRNSTKSLRLEQETVNGKQIIHNYGHGGAGVTLSWGCALEAARIISGKEIEELASEVQAKLGKPHVST
ncbi:MAG TPA: FAD-dependent oxidoreductase [Fodinibius sp.]|nr:FAD-dependent oxidoreductase [Fodinibius sp.]